MLRNYSKVWHDSTHIAGRRIMRAATLSQNKTETHHIKQEYLCWGGPWCMGWEVLQQALWCSEGKSMPQWKHHSSRWRAEDLSWSHSFTWFSCLGLVTINHWEIIFWNQVKMERISHWTSISCIFWVLFPSTKQRKYEGRFHLSLISICGGIW